MAQEAFHFWAVFEKIVVVVVASEIVLHFEYGQYDALINYLLQNKFRKLSKYVAIIFKRTTTYNIHQHLHNLVLAEGSFHYLIAMFFNSIILLNFSQIIYLTTYDNQNQT